MSTIRLSDDTIKLERTIEISVQDLTPVFAVGLADAYAETQATFFHALAERIKTFTPTPDMQILFMAEQLSPEAKEFVRKLHAFCETETSNENR